MNGILLQEALLATELDNSFKEARMELATTLTPKTVQGLSKYNINMDNCKIGVIGDNVTIHTLSL